MMDSTTSSALSAGEKEPALDYVSCIKVDGAPILPPIMTKERRVEMQHYRELAIEAERRMRERALTQVISRPSTVESLGTAFSADFLTSTPIGNKGDFDWEEDERESKSGPSSGDTFIIRREGEDSLEGEQVVETPPDSGDDDEEEEGFPNSGVSNTVLHTTQKKTEEQEETETAASTTTTTNTLVLEEQTTLVTELEGKEMEGANPPGQTPPVINQTRKRPAKYFSELDDEEEDKENKGSTTEPGKASTTFSDEEEISTSLSKYVTISQGPESPFPTSVLEDTQNSSESEKTPRRSGGSGDRPRSRRRLTNSRSPAGVVKRLVFPDSDDVDVPTDADSPGRWSNNKREGGQHGPPIVPFAYPAPNFNFGSIAASSVSVSSPAPGSPGPNVHPTDKISSMGLSKFQNKMLQVNPYLFKNPPNARSPQRALLKGLVFPDPLDRPPQALKVPSGALDPAMKVKFERLTAAVKGYLTRRLLGTERIQIIIQTIKDTVELLLSLYEECPPDDNGLVQVKEEDQDLHFRLVQQLTGACSSFHDIFFKISIKERMAIISTDREKIRAKALKNVLNRRGTTVGSPSSKKNVSSATLKSMERRLTLSRSPPRNTRVRGSTSAPLIRSPLAAGSQSVRPKKLKSFNLSPKRRRMSFWNESSNRLVDSRSTTTVSSARSNVSEGMHVISRRPYTALSSRSAASTAEAPPTSSSAWSARGFSTDTFVVPSNSWTGNPLRNSSSRANRPSVSSSNKFSIGDPPPNRQSVSRTSVSRVPWK